MIELFILLCVLLFGSMALINTTTPPPKVYNDDRYDQRQFDNSGCGWWLIIMFFGACAVAVGLFSLLRYLTDKL